MARLELPTPSGCLAAPMHLELLENVVNVILHGRHLDAQAAGDVLVRQAIVEQAHNLQLPRREMRRGNAYWLRLRELRQAPQQTSRHSRRAQCLTPYCAFQRRHEITERRIARHVPGYPSLSAGAYVAFGI